MNPTSKELLLLYWDVGRPIAARQEQEGWGAGVIPRLAQDLASDLPGVKGFSERNLKRMVQFFDAYPDLDAAREPIEPQPVAQFAAPDCEGNGSKVGVDPAELEIGGELRSNFSFRAALRSAANGRRRQFLDQASRFFLEANDYVRSAGYPEGLVLILDSPEPRAVKPPQTGRLVELPLVGGLHHRYVRRAA